MASPYYAQFIPTVSKFRQKSRSTAAHLDHHRKTSSAGWVKHSFRIATCFTGLVSQLHTRRSRCQIAPPSALPEDTPADLLLHSISQNETERLRNHRP
jgi:hypothetical protein